MVIAWLVIAAILYVPFKQWSATAEAPFLSALLWPLLVAFFVFGMPVMFLIDKIKAREPLKNSPTLP